MKQWDYFHCPPDVPHAVVGAGDGLSLVLAVGSRVGPDVILYPRDEVALKHGAGVEKDTASPQDAYSRFPHWRLGRPERWRELPWDR